MQTNIRVYLSFQRTDACAHACRRVTCAHVDTILIGTMKHRNAFDWYETNMPCTTAYANALPVPAPTQVYVFGGKLRERIYMFLNDEIKASLNAENLSHVLLSCIFILFTISTFILTQMLLIGTN